MRKKDRLLKEAFLVYHSANEEQEKESNSLNKALPEYTEGFEDKIYHCIKRLHITNPRTKARKIKLIILGVFVLCCTFIKIRVF